MTIRKYESNGLEYWEYIIEDELTAPPGRRLGELVRWVKGVVPFRLYEPNLSEPIP